MEVTYVHPPHVIVRNKPVPATSFGRAELGRAVRMYQRNTKANRGPAHICKTSLLAEDASQRTGCNCDKQLEDCAFRIPISNGRRHRRKPFLRITLPSRSEGPILQVKDLHSTHSGRFYGSAIAVQRIVPPRTRCTQRLYVPTIPISRRERPRHRHPYILAPSRVLPSSLSVYTV